MNYFYGFTFNILQQKIVIFQPVHCTSADKDDIFFCLGDLTESGCSDIWGAVSKSRSRIEAADERCRCHHSGSVANGFFWIPWIQEASFSVFM